jgi:hypothetical protein
MLFEFNTHFLQLLLFVDGLQLEPGELLALCRGKFRVCRLVSSISFKLSENGGLFSFNILFDIARFEGYEGPPASWLGSCSR